VVHFSFGTIPAGAEVWSATGQRLGVTPLTVEGPRTGGLASYSFRLPGYREARLELPLERDDSRVVVLVVDPQPAAPPAPTIGQAAPAGVMADGGSQPAPPADAGLALPTPPSPPSAPASAPDAAPDAN
jgi:hypothetical protein